jgi:hypothetical protein
MNRGFGQIPIKDVAKFAKRFRAHKFQLSHLEMENIHTLNRISRERLSSILLAKSEGGSSEYEEVAIIDVRDDG